jgi:chromosome segregation ATPase
LLDLPEAELPPRETLEHTLTSGYAYALGLERERVRLERRLHELLQSAEALSGEMTELSAKLTHAERELADVRALLAELREQTFS